MNPELRAAFDAIKAEIQDGFLSASERSRTTDMRLQHMMDRIGYIDDRIDRNDRMIFDHLRTIEEDLRVLRSETRSALHQGRSQRSPR